jgi:PEP-CTERM motif
MARSDDGFVVRRPPTETVRFHGVDLLPFGLAESRSDSQIPLQELLSMKFAFHKLSILTLGLAALAFAQPASAGLVTDTQTLLIGSEASPLSTLSTPSTVTLNFNQFDTTLGTLMSVTISLSDSSTVVSQAQNGTSSQGNFTNFENTGTLTVTGPDSTTTSTSLSTTPGSGMVSPGSTITVATAVSNFLSSGPTAVTTLTAYEGVGAGTFNVIAGASNSFSGSGGGIVFSGGNTSVYGSVTITYTYSSAVPEPASMAMVAIGLGGVFVVRRFRRRSA